jgi:hypothetical protein
MKLFYGKRRDIENKIIDRVENFVSLIKKDKKLRKFVKVFGITGPAGRGQASFGNSDIDFYCITNKLNPFKERYLHKRFNECFKGIDYDISLLAFAPSVLKKPDLMFFEFVNSGKFLYGKLKGPIKYKIQDIPKWEGIRLLTFKGNPFLAHIGTDKEEYYFSKLILGIGESFLLLDNKYVADDFKRKDLVLKNKYAKQIKGFVSLYKKSFDYRYKNKKIDVDFKKEGLRLWKTAWKIYLEEYFDCSYEKALLRLKKIRPDFLRQIGTRVFYTLNYWKYFRKIRFCCKEPFIHEILMIQKYFKNPSEGLKKKITESWKVSPRFWYFK